MGFGPQDSGHDDEEFARQQLERFERDVGGAQQLAELDAVPLPDEPFRWDGIPDDIVAGIDEVLTLVDGCCDAMFDAEIRTGCRRLLAHLAVTGPQVFRRAKKIAIAAPSVVWLVAKANNALGLHYGLDGPQAQELAAHFGLASPSAKASALLQAGGFDWRNSNSLTLSSPMYLTSRRRQQIIDLRDRYQAVVDTS
jgi:hypothetical protein